MNRSERDRLFDELLELYYDCHENPEPLLERLTAEPELQELFDEVKRTAGVINDAARSPAPELKLCEPRKSGPRRLLLFAETDEVCRTEEVRPQNVPRFEHVARLVPQVAFAIGVALGACVDHRFVELREMAIEVRLKLLHVDPRVIRGPDARPASCSIR